MKPKIFATLSPFSEPLKGYDVVRLNGAHGTIAWHREMVRKLHTQNIPVLLDLPGHKIRLAHIETPLSWKDNEIVELPRNNINLSLAFTEGTKIFISDGRVQVEVVEVLKDALRCKVLIGGTIQNGDGVNIPSIQWEHMELSPRDQELLDENMGADMLGISFCESKSQVDMVRPYAQQIIAKIETQRGVDRLEEICQSADMIMIARGDLAIETSLLRIGLLQEEIIRRSTKPVIVATGLLESMCDHHIPMKAEVCDITRLVSAGIAGLVLADETASGAHGQESIDVLHGILNEVLGQRS